MMTLLVPLFYLWLVITILLAAMWFLHRHDMRNAGDDQDLVPEPEPGPEAAPDPVPTDDTVEAEERAETEDDDQTADQAEDLAEAEDQDQTADQAEADGGRSTSLAGLLADASFPFDLTPTTDRIADPARHAIFISPHSDAEAVGTAFADELARIGYTIEPDGLDQARATGDGRVLMLRICPDAGTRGSGAYRRYPTAAATDVAIEVWTGQDKPPRLAP